MKDLTIYDIQQIEGGAFWDTFCKGIGVADAVGGGMAALARLGLISLNSGPAAPYIALGLAGVTIACIATT